MDKPQYNIRAQEAKTSKYSMQ